MRLRQNIAVMPHSMEKSLRSTDIGGLGVITKKKASMTINSQVSFRNPEEVPEFESLYASTS